MPPIPQLPEIRFRAPAADDETEIAEVFNACAQADGIDPLSTLERLATADDARGMLDTPENAIVAEADGRIVAYNRVAWWREAGDIWLFLHTGRVQPDYRGRGIGTALLTWSETRIREIAPQIAGGGTPLFGANASSTEVEATRLLRDHGYDVAFTLAAMRHSSITAVEPLSIDGIDIRPPRVDDAEAMHYAQQAAWGDGLYGLPEESDDALIAEIRETIMAGAAEHWRVAWHGAEIAGQVWCSVSERAGVKVGVFDEVNTSAGYRRRGIAQALMTHMLAEFAALGCVESRLHTDADNRAGARSLYEKLGFVTLKTFPRYRKPL